MNCGPSAFLFSNLANPSSCNSQILFHSVLVYNTGADPVLGTDPTFSENTVVCIHLLGL